MASSKRLNHAGQEIVIHASFFHGTEPPLPAKELSKPEKSVTKSTGFFFPTEDEEKDIEKPWRDTSLPRIQENALRAKAMLEAEAAPEAACWRAPIEFPPGVAEQLVNYVYRGSYMPIPEVAVAAALGVLAGICGKAFLTPTDTGLNLYIVLIAKSATGKEGMHDAASAVMNAVREHVPLAQEFFVFEDFASGQALLKRLAEFPCFVNLSGEFGEKLNMIGRSYLKPNPAMESLRRAMMDLFHKSGPNIQAGGMRYSEKDKNVHSVEGAAFSLLGDTTPQNFYRALTPDMMENGFMSRFLLIEYDGDRPEPNRQRDRKLPPQLLEHLAKLASHALDLIRRSETVTVKTETAADELLLAFDQECHARINAESLDERRQMWARAHLKALKVASLLAVADNPYHPVITTAHAEWGISLVRRDIATFTKRLDEGEVGSGDAVRQKRVAGLIKKYVNQPLSAKQMVYQRMRKEGVVPWKYLSQHTSSDNCFKSHPTQTHSQLLKAAVKALVDNGDLVAVPTNKKLELRFNGECYYIQPGLMHD